MRIISSTGREDLAVVYIAEANNGKLIEFVESLQPPKPREEKWVLIISTLYGCPVQCQICDAGMFYEGKIGREDLFAQIDYLITNRYPDRVISSKQFKIQFARMGEPSFNMNVLDVLDEFDLHYNAPGFIPSISTIAPISTDKFFERMLQIKCEKFSNGNFQFQFSIHTTDEKKRDELLPVKKWSFKKMAEYGEVFFQPSDRKVTLNFAATNEYPVEPKIVLEHFDPDKFIVKLTPLNPTYKSHRSRLTSYLGNEFSIKNYDIVEEFQKCGYEVIISIGELEENQIGSNCGQYVLTHIKNNLTHPEGYHYASKNNLLNNNFFSSKS